MMIIGCDLHTRYQQIAMVDTETGEFVERRLEHEGGEAQTFYAGLKGAVRVGIEATGHTAWFEAMLAELGHELWMGDAAKIRAGGWPGLSVFSASRSGTGGAPSLRLSSGQALAFLARAGSDAVLSLPARNSLGRRSWHPSIGVPIPDMGSQSPHPLFAKGAKRRMGHPALVIRLWSSGTPQALKCG